MQQMLFIYSVLTPGSSLELPVLSSISCANEQGPLLQEFKGTSDSDHSQILHHAATWESLCSLRFMCLMGKAFSKSGSGLTMSA